MVEARVSSGTGSYPDGPNGRQRTSRRIVSQEPRRAPWTSKASTAYSEQVGKKRQGEGCPSRWRRYHATAPSKNCWLR